MTKKHYYWLDCIRFISALLVVGVHVRCVFFNTYSELEENSQNLFSQLFFAVNSFGTQAVIIFFIISGFLVGGRNLERIIENRINLKEYIIDRSVRIFLPLISSLLLILIVDTITNEYHTIEVFCGNLMGLQGVLVEDIGGVFWTLSYEVWFYILIGSLMCLFCTNGKYVLIGIAFFLTSVIIFTNLITSYIFYFSFGIIAYYISRYRINKNSIILIMLFGVLLWIMINLVSETKTELSRLSIPFLKKDSVTLIFGMSVAIILSQIVNKKPKGLLLKIEHLGSKLSVFSYSLYLTHFQWCRIMRYLGIPKYEYVNIYSILLFITEVVVCIIMSYIFYLFTEKYTSKIKHHIKTYY